MDRLQKENLQFHLNRRLQLVESLTAELAAVGLTFRQLDAVDKKLLESFKREIDFPQEITPAGFKAMFDEELYFQLQHGDPIPGSFNASVAAPRQDLTEKVKDIHTAILGGN